LRADPVEAIARAVLYEGYLLYPYTRSSAKNQVRWTFGGVYPPAWEADPSLMRTECLLRVGQDGQAGCRVGITVRCLQLMERTAPGEPPWQEAAERTVVELGVAAEGLLEGPPPVTQIGLAAGGSVEDQGSRRWEAIEGTVTVSAAALEDASDVLRLTVRIENTTSLPEPDREAALLRALVSTHTVLRAEGGAFVSLADPPAELREAAAACANQGTWPVLVGPPGSTDVMLSSPIILEDHPQVAEESPGDLFDATEIDEILTLRILTLSDREKAELRRTDERARDLLDRTESLTGEDLMRLHGTLRGGGR
jgi:hypothetical protein